MAGPIMELDEARKVVRPPIVAGGVYRFYSTMQGQDADGNWPALYSGRECEALAPLPVDEEVEPLWRVRFGDVELDAYVGELNGWYFDTGQWHGPLAAALEGAVL